MEGKIKAIVFSKNRACQLDLHLRSIELNASDIFDISVIYTYSSKKFGEGYKRTIKRHPNVKWVFEDKDLKELILEELNCENKYVVLFGEEDIIYKELKDTSFLKNMDDSIVCFSLRHGENTVYSYQHRKDINFPQFEYKNDYIKWNWAGANFEFGYPLGIGGHIYRTEELLQWTTVVEFKTPNKYEAHLAMLRKEGGIRPKMISFRESVLVDVPLNKVQIDYPNTKCGDKYPISVTKFNNVYLKGKVIDYSKFDFSNITSVQQELKVSFI